MKKENIDDDQNTKEIFLWAWLGCHGIDPGHVAVQIGEFIYGFTYRGEKYVPNAMGEITKESEGQLSESYIEKHFDRYKILLTEGKKVLPDQNPSTRTAHVYSLCVPSEDYNFLYDLYEESYVKPPHYHRDENNCVTTTIDSLHELNLINIEKVNRPKKFIEQMDEKVGYSDGLVRGFITAKRKLHVRYKNTRGYFWATEEASLMEMRETEAK